MLPVYSRSLLASLGLLAILAFGAAPTAVAEPFDVDAVHSSVLFRIKHMNTSYAWGRFNDISGTVNLEGPQAAIDIELTVDSIDTANQKRDEHLEGPDFFNAKQFPTIGFKSTKITKVDDTHYEVDGELTLHGVTKPIQVRVERTGAALNLMGKKILGIASEFRIKRSDYGMKYLVGPIADDVLLFVSLECIAQ